MAAAAYRSGEKIVDLRTGEIHDYTRKQNVDHKEIIGFDGSRSDLWNAAERSERRKNSTVAREYEVALPVELSRDQSIELTREYGQWLHERHGVAVDICIHALNADNPHAHILTTTRQVVNGIELGDKVAREWSDKNRAAAGLPGRKKDLEEAREKWGEVQNRALEKQNVQARVDHRSFGKRGLQKVATKHLGAAATALERRGEPTRRGQFNRIVKALNVRLHLYGEIINRSFDQVRGRAEKIAQSFGDGDLEKINAMARQAMKNSDMDKLEQAAKQIVGKRKSPKRAGLNLSREKDRGYER